MKVLSAKGLIESRAGVGARVQEERYWNQLDADVLAWRCASMPTDDFVDKLVEMRELIEPAAAAAAARHRTAAQLAEIVKHPVVNAGVSGETTAEGRARLSATLDEQQPARPEATNLAAQLGADAAAGARDQHDAAPDAGANDCFV